MRDETKKKPMISFFGKLLYGCSNLSLSLLLQSTIALLLFYYSYTKTGHIWIVGLGGFLALVLAAFTAPLIANRSDNATGIFFGRRHFFILIATLALPIANVFLWASLGDGLVNPFLIAFLGLFLVEFLGLVFYIPYYSLSNELAGDSFERRAFEKVKRLFFSIGLVVLSICWLVIFSLYDITVVDGYQNLSYISSILFLVFGALTFFLTYPHIPRLRAKNKPTEEPTGDNSIKQVYSRFFSPLKQKGFRNFVIAHALSMVAVFVLTVLSTHFFVFSVNLSMTQTAALFLVFFIASMLSHPLFALLSKKMQKKDLVFLGICLIILGLCLLSVLFILKLTAVYVAGYTWFMVSVIICAVGAKPLFELPRKILLDFVPQKKLREIDKDYKQRAIILSTMTRLSKAAAFLVSAVTLSAFGFERGNQDVLTKAGVGYTMLALAIGCLIAAMTLFIKGVPIEVKKDGTDDNLETTTITKEQ